MSWWTKKGRRVLKIGGLAALGALTGGVTAAGSAGFLGLSGATAGALAGAGIGGAMGAQQDSQERAAEKLAKESDRANAEALANDQRQAATEAGNQVSVSDSGTESALSKILKRRSALQRSIRTSGQSRLGD